MNEPNKSTNPLHTIFFKAPWSLRFGFIIALLLVILSLGNVILYSFLGMQINSIVFLTASLVTFLIVFFGSLQSAYGNTAVNWVMFIIAVAGIIIVAATTGFFKNVPKAELDNISTTLIALSFGCTVIFAFCSGYSHVVGPVKEVAATKDEEETTALDSAEIEANEDTQTEETVLENSIDTNKTVNDEAILQDNNEDNNNA